MNKNTASLTGAVSCPSQAPCCYNLVPCDLVNQIFVAMQKLYVTMFPCNECAKLLIQAGIQEVIFYEVSLPPGGIRSGQPVVADDF